LGKEEALLSVALSPLDGTTMGASLDVSGLPRLASDCHKQSMQHARLSEKPGGRFRSPLLQTC
jgi:hypothetical protein